MIATYDNYDYKTQFWSTRDYEHQVELTLLSTLIHRYSQALGSLHTADIGCGFGRLLPAYAAVSDRLYLVDYSQDMLQQAKQTVQTLGLQQPVQYYQASVYQLPDLPVLDLVILMRVLHHTPDIDLIMTELYAKLAKNGLLILDIPNQMHSLNRLRFYMGKLKQNPFLHREFKHGDAFYNYHPDAVLALAQAAGFRVLGWHTHSFLRHRWLTRVMPAGRLAQADRILQYIIGRSYYGPSVYAVLQKCT